MLFHRARTKLIDHSLYIGNSILARIDTCQFLGVFVDQYLTFKPHIQYLTNKVSKNIRIIYPASTRNRDPTGSPRGKKSGARLGSPSGPRWFMTTGTSRVPPGSRWFVLWAPHGPRISCPTSLSTGCPAQSLHH